MSSPTGAGWYPDPHAPSVMRWWDGQQWGPDAPAPVRTAEPPLGAEMYLLAVLLPIVGAIAGVVYMARGRSGGLAVLVVSVMAFVFWLAVFAQQGTA